MKLPYPDERTRRAIFCLAALLGLAGCGGTSGNGNHTPLPDGALPDGALPDGHLTDGGQGDGGSDQDGSTTPPAALLEVHALDIWAQPLPQSAATLQISSGSSNLAHSGWPVATAPLLVAGTYVISLAAPEHETASVSMTWSGGGGLADASFTLDPAVPDHGLSVSRELRVVEGRQIPVYQLYLGLRHRWFSAQGRPARRGNRRENVLTVSTNSSGTIPSRSKIGARSAGIAPRLSSRTWRPVQSSNRR